MRMLNKKSLTLILQMSHSHFFVATGLTSSSRHKSEF